MLSAFLAAATAGAFLPSAPEPKPVFGPELPPSLSFSHQLWSTLASCTPAPSPKAAHHRPAPPLAALAPLLDPRSPSGAPLSLVSLPTLASLLRVHGLAVFCALRAHPRGPITEQEREALEAFKPKDLGLAGQALTELFAALGGSDDVRFWSGFVQNDAKEDPAGLEGFALRRVDWSEALEAERETRGWVLQDGAWDDQDPDKGLFSMLERALEKNEKGRKGGASVGDLATVGAAGQMFGRAESHPCLVVVGSRHKLDETASSELNYNLVLSAAMRDSWDELEDEIWQQLTDNIDLPKDLIRPMAQKEGDVQKWRLLALDEFREADSIQAAFVHPSGWIDSDSVHRLVRVMRKNAEEETHDRNPAAEPLPLLLVSTNPLGAGRQGSVFRAMCAPPAAPLAIKYSLSTSHALKLSVAPPFEGNFRVERSPFGGETHAIVMAEWGEAVKSWKDVPQDAVDDFLDRIYDMHLTHNVSHGSMWARNILLRRDFPTAGKAELRLVDWARASEDHYGVPCAKLVLGCPTLTKLENAIEKDEAVCSHCHRGSAC
ncbi:uncharacterized protein JCM10292_005233 [Rhodotorula paludigena]|uniref:uncharacterized protein n=1 Tax=Rhodotorula paludigena TaxID=86838 RepID=UPI003175CE0D